MSNEAERMELYEIVLTEADRLRVSVPLCGVVTEVVKTVKFERGWPTPQVDKT